jgi:hypothetical protein
VSNLREGCHELPSRDAIQPTTFSALLGHPVKRRHICPKSAQFKAISACEVLNQRRDPKFFFATARYTSQLLLGSHNRWLRASPYVFNLSSNITARRRVFRVFTDQPPDSDTLQENSNISYRRWLLRTVLLSLFFFAL